QCLFNAFFGNDFIFTNSFGRYGNYFRKEKKRFQALVHRMEFLRNMPETFGMRTMRMRIEKHVVEIYRTTFRNLPYPIAHFYGFNGWFALIPRQRIFFRSPQRD